MAREPQKKPMRQCEERRCKNAAWWRRYRAAFSRQRSIYALTARVLSACRAVVIMKLIVRALLRRDLASGEVLWPRGENGARAAGAVAQSKIVAAAAASI